MKTTCPHCKKEFDLKSSAILAYITASQMFRDLVSSHIGKINAAKRRTGANPNMKRGTPEYYAQIARKGWENRKKKDNEGGKND